MSDLVERLRKEIVADDFTKLMDEAADRIEALEAALQLIADIGEGSTTANSLPHIGKIARAALASEQWPQDAIDQEMINRTDDGWSLAKGKDK